MRVWDNTLMASPDDTDEPTLKSAQLERERLNSLINSMGDGVIALDKDYKIVITNGAALNIIDVNSPPNGQQIDSVLHLFDKNDQELNVHKVVRETKSHFSSREWKLKLSDGELINLYVSIAPVQAGYGRSDELNGYVIILRDITKEKSLEEERDEFISVVSHELRTPITIAEGNIGNAEFIFKQSGLKHNEVETALNEAHEQTIFLSEMINDLAMLSRAERGKLHMQVESINVHDLIKSLAATYSPEIERKGLKLHTDADNSLSLLQSSKLYVKEILQNFITNSIKYTKSGSITIGAKQKNDGIEFYVSDTGIGISKSDKEKLFDKFFRSEDYRTRETGGTGLGLYITLKLASLLHAEIDVDSKLNEGSTFTIYIPNVKQG